MAFYELGDSIDEMVAEETECFLCGEFIKSETVFWMGHKKNIGLHPKCARRLGQNLIFDSYAGDRKNQFKLWLEEIMGNSKQ